MVQLEEGMLMRDVSVMDEWDQQWIDIRLADGYLNQIGGWMQWIRSTDGCKISDQQMDRD
jgi:hypothetical protein